jgi:hypothetical protein
VEMLSEMGCKGAKKELPNHGECGAITGGIGTLGIFGHIKKKKTGQIKIIFLTPL